MKKFSDSDVFIGAGSNSKKFARCYESHPVLPFGKAKVYGGSCHSPIIGNADVYVGLDSGMVKSSMSYPWEQGESFLYRIEDMQAPKDSASFRKLIDWLAKQCEEPKVIHIGCIGGHGRTGTVLAALLNVMSGEKDAIHLLRDSYCKKAVESQAQVNFLIKQFGIEKAAATKHFDIAPKSQSYWLGNDVPPTKTNVAELSRKAEYMRDKYASKGRSFQEVLKNAPSLKKKSNWDSAMDTPFDITPVRVKGNIWGEG